MPRTIRTPEGGERRIAKSDVDLTTLRRERLCARERHGMRAHSKATEKGRRAARNAVDHYDCGGTVEIHLKEPGRDRIHGRCAQSRISGSAALRGRRGAGENGLRARSADACLAAARA